MSEARRAEFLGGRRGLPVSPSNAVNPKGRVVGCPGGSPRGAGQAAPPWLAGKAKDGLSDSAEVTGMTAEPHGSLPARG